MKILKRVLALWGLLCPGCIIGRKHPDSFIGKLVNKHWEKGCPVHKAYLEFHKPKGD